MTVATGLTVIGSHFVSLEGKFLLIALANAPKCPLNNGVSIVQKLVVKLSNTSTMLFPPVAKTLSKCLRVCDFI